MPRSAPCPALATARPEPEAPPRVPERPPDRSVDGARYWSSRRPRAPRPRCPVTRWADEPLIGHDPLSGTEPVCQPRSRPPCRVSGYKTSPDAWTSRARTSGNGRPRASFTRTESDAPGRARPSRSSTDLARRSTLLERARHVPLGAGEQGVDAWRLRREAERTRTSTHRARSSPYQRSVLSGPSSIWVSSDIRRTWAPTRWACPAHPPRRPRGRSRRTIDRDLTSSSRPETTSGSR